MANEGSYVFGQPIEAVVNKRKSVRSYSRTPVEQRTREDILEYFKQIKGPFQEEVRIKLLDRLKIRNEDNIKLGTYGMIQGASLFIAAAVRNGEHSMEQVGYMLEKLILYITTKGLGTCWMAGTFNKGEFFKAMGPGSDEVLPVVSPVGYPSRIKSPVDLLLKPIPGHRPRKPWGSLFFKESLEKALDPQETGPYAQALAMVRLAPSAANRQPWRIIEAGGEFRFYLAHDPLAANRHAFDVQKIDMGIAMCHFECTAAECGLKGRWEVRQPEGGEPRKGLEYIATWVPV